MDSTSSNPTRRACTSTGVMVPPLLRTSDSYDTGNWRSNSKPMPVFSMLMVWIWPIFMARSSSPLQPVMPTACRLTSVTLPSQSVIMIGSTLSSNRSR